MEIPNIEKAFEYENNFYMSCDPGRIGKLIAHYELFKDALSLPGEIIEFGVFKGVSLIRFAILRHLFSNENSKKIIGFDTFGRFPEPEFDGDRKHTEDFIKEAGDTSIGEAQLTDALRRRGMDKNVELIKGDICNTASEYCDRHPELKVSLLHIDVDLYEPTQVILDHFYTRVVAGGVIIFDDYATFGGETKAIDEFFKGKNVEIKKFPFILRPSYMIKKMEMA